MVSYLYHGFSYAASTISYYVSNNPTSGEDDEDDHLLDPEFLDESPVVRRNDSPSLERKDPILQDNYFNSSHAYNVTRSDPISSQSTASVSAAVFSSIEASQPTDFSLNSSMSILSSQSSNSTISGPVSSSASAQVVELNPLLQKNLGDLEIAKQILNELKDVKVTDTAYEFIPKDYARKAKVTDADGKAVSQAYNVASALAQKHGKNYHNDKDAITLLGRITYQDPLLKNNPKTKRLIINKNKAGQCDHLAAAVIAKAIANPNWKSKLELVGTGGHAFVLVGRAEGANIKNPMTWGKDCFIIDAWTNNVGVNETFKEMLTPGLLTNIEDMKKQLRCFGLKHFQVHQTWTIEELSKRNFTDANGTPCFPVFGNLESSLEEDIGNGDSPLSPAVRTHRSTLRPINLSRGSRTQNANRAGLSSVSSQASIALPSVIEGDLNEVELRSLFSPQRQAEDAARALRASRDRAYNEMSEIRARQEAEDKAAEAARAQALTYVDIAYQVQYAQHVPMDVRINSRRVYEEDLASAPKDTYEHKNEEPQTLTSSSNDLLEATKQARLLERAELRSTLSQEEKMNRIKIAEEAKAAARLFASRINFRAISFL